jgi:hypothetical protein
MKTIYILHEAHSLCDYNDCEVFNDYETAKKFFGLTKKDIQSRNDIEEVYTDEDEEYYVQIDGDSIRIYITEHTID